MGGKCREQHAARPGVRQGMKLAFSALAVLIAAAVAHAELPKLPAGGTEALRGAPAEYVNADAKATITSDGKGGFKVDVQQQAVPAWSLGVSQEVGIEVKKGDVLALMFTVSGRGKLSPEASINAVFERFGDPWEKSLDQSVTVGPEAQTFVLPFVAEGDYAVGKSHIGLRFGEMAQNLMLSDIRLVSYGTRVKLADLPGFKIGYPGREADAAWRKAALERIDKLRRGDLVVTVMDASGKAVRNAEVRVEMTKHAFKFGTALPAARLMEQSADGEKFRTTVLEHFNYATLENDLKWPNYLDNPDLARRGVDWLTEHGLSIRGHNLIWPSFTQNYFMPKAVVEKYQALSRTDAEAAKKYLRDACADRVLSVTKAFAGKIRDWDVINETFGNHDIQDVLGKDVMVDWYKLAHQGDPNATLFLNDYGILEGAGRDQAHIDFFFNELKYLKDRGAPIGGVGIQGHWGATLTDPTRMLAILDRYATLGLKIQITEFDININDEQAQADFTRDAMITVFSHPAVDAFILWGFWENSHWLPKGAMFRADWSKKPNALAYEDLVLKQWWTRETVKTDAAGVAKVRGFAGTYEITVTAQGKSQTAKTNLTREGGAVAVRLQ